MAAKTTLLSLLLVLTMGLVGCSSDSDKNAQGDSMIEDATKNVNLELNGSSDDGSAGPLQTVFFAYDSSSLSEAARSTLEDNAKWLKLSEAVDIQIEGHCDERGGQQYNLALGERRARAVRDYLVALGVSEARVSVISYGKEKPVAFGHDDESWSRNRRANFVITAK